MIDLDLTMHYLHRYFFIGQVRFYFRVFTSLPQVLLAHIKRKKECSIGWKHSFLYYRVTFSSTTFSLTTPFAFGTLL